MSQTRGKKLFSIGAAFMFLALTLSFTSVTWADGKRSESGLIVSPGSAHRVFDLALSPLS